MSCISPITLVRKKVNKFTEVVPCGRCVGCHRKRQSHWLTRLTYELKEHEKASFITLTYDSDNIRFSENGIPTLSKRDVQLFIKRLRKRLPQKIRYYAVGEYGSSSNRPHYHAIIYGSDFSDIDINSLWSYGHTHVGECNPKTIAYTTKYLMKNIRWYGDPKADADGVIDDRLIEFALMSKGLGKNFLTEKNKKWYQRKMLPYIIAEGGRKLPMPRYYRERLYTEDQQKVLAKKTAEYVEEQEIAMGSPLQSWSKKREQIVLAKKKSKLRDKL